MAETGNPDLSRDEFLGGRLRLDQPRHGYRAGIDPVLLAASVPARPGQSVLDLGCGVGAVALCLGARVAGLSLAGIERQPLYADLARGNAERNGQAMAVFTGDLAAMPDALRQRRFDHVLANPPYFDRTTSSAAPAPLREAAMGQDTALACWIETAARRCLPGGHVSLIHRAERLPELLSLAMRHLGSLEVLPLIPRAERAARLIILRGRKGGRAAFRLHDGWRLHDGPTHPGDRENYTPQTLAILRDAAPLPFSECF